MKRFFLILAVVFFVMPARADEGMWLLPYLNKLNIKDMKAMGLKLSANDIYNVNGNSLKDAIVIFGGGCTGEVVSPDGLLLTNHHCGYGAIQQLSTVESDYLKNGFWAMSRAEEIPAPGLRVTFIRRIEDVTSAVLGDGTMEVGPQRDSLVKANVAKVTAEFTDKFPEYAVAVRSFMGGNQYFAIMSEVYTDVRLVGTPPNSMGKFGGDTDNWMWPRHTADFSMFRIYAGPDNRPAEYSPENRPYKAPVHLKISLKGFKETDFAMIMGFPGSTQRYMTTYEMQYLMDVENANRIFIRGERQKILMEDMLADNKVRLQYSAKYASSSNYWKNSIGMNKALAENRIGEYKQALEDRFAAWAAGAGRSGEYGLALGKIKEAVEAKAEAEGVSQYLTEAFLRAVEILTVPATVDRIVRKDEEGNIVNAADVLEYLESFYKDFSEPTDRRVAKRMFAIVRENIAPKDLPLLYSDVIDKEFGGDTDAYVDWLYDNSMFATQERAETFMAAFDQDLLEQDPALMAFNSILAERLGLTMRTAAYRKQLADWHGVYVRGLSEMEPGAKHYPDANFTIRLTYGQVLSFEPRDGVIYKYYTTLRGVMEKEDPSNPLEFTVPAELRKAYETSDFGPYAQNGQLRVNFITNNDITGGNSGSPVMNGRGELIGLAFDGNWEAMSGDVVFEPELQRCINVDIRYVLWIVDKFAGAGYLLDEMTIVR